MHCEEAVDHSRRLKVLLMTHQRRFKIHARAFPWAHALAARGHKIDILCHADTERWTTCYEYHPGFRIVHTPDLLVGALRQGWDLVCAIRRSLFLFRERQEYDIIHCLDTRPSVVLPGLAYARTMGIPIVSDWIDWWGRGGLIRDRRPFWYRILFEGFETFFEEYFRNKLDGLTAISAALLERGIRLGVPREKCLQIPGGADVSHFSCVPSKEGARRTLDILHDRPVMCFSGLDVLIDLPLVISTFERVLSSFPNTLLLLVGPSAELLSATQQEFVRRRQIICTGPVPYSSLPRYLAAADLFIMPFTNKISNVGRWPNKIGDYMCVGRPTVSNPVGEVKLLFEHFDIGRLADEDPESMAHAVCMLISNPQCALEIGSQARNVAERVFAWERLIETLEKWYYDIAAGLKRTSVTD